MKFCQVKRKNIIFKIVILFIFIILFFGLYFNNAKALIDSNATPSEGEIKTIDIFLGGKVEELHKTNIGGWMKRLMNQIFTWTREDFWKALDHATALAYKKALGHFLDTLAFDMATYLATGDKGQLPMFEAEGWGGYLKNVADSTAGAFIQELGKKSSIQFNLCQPNFDVMFKIRLGLDKTHARRPIKPACTFSELVNNWDAALNDKDFLPKFQDMFNPWSNDLGIALTLQTGLEAEISRKVNEAAYDRLEGEGFKPVRDFISKHIKTPAKIVEDAALDTLRKSSNQYFVYTGDAIADAIDVFINTLIGKLIDKWLRQGLVTDFPANTDRFNNLGQNSLTDPDAQKQDEGIAGAEGRFRSLIEPNFKVRAAYNILAELTICPDPNKAGPTNCVIDEKFRQAIEKRLTVSQALEQGYLNGNGVFGFTADGLEPRFNEGYPYRSMLILRKFRIIPLGWEIAGQYIKDCQNNTDLEKCKQGNVSGTKNLNDLVNCAAAWCLGLVDPNWVLKAPQNFCKKQGPGPEILSEQVTGEGAGSSLSILRNDNYCADEQSLINETDDGSNPLYGYCTEERRIWDFNGKSCAARDNTCQTFQNGDQTVSYLQNTLDFGDCNVGNAGCKKYATSGSYNVESKSVDWDGDDNPVYLNRNAASCEAADQGCQGFIRTIPEKTETYADIITAGIDKAYDRFKPAGLIYEKLLPDYLVEKEDGNRKDYDEGVCYDDHGRLKILAPAVCSNFVRQCQAEEAGCELYTDVTDGFKIPAKVKPPDYCPAECVGYDTFVQKETIFDSSRDAYFIPKTAKTCSAESSGCDQFTNLDEVKKGGEGIEYYTYLRQCLKKSGNDLNCGEFYNWEGSDESGYQLKVESLKIKVGGVEPAVTEDDSLLCTEEIYNLLPSNPAYNPDCRQFYNREGGISYHLYRRTISCSDNCHPYRRTELNVDENITREDCSGVDKHWDGEQCLVCKSGGVWSDDNKACIYMAIPGQGAFCSAAQNLCREYNGNTGNDIRNIFTDDFSGGIIGWSDVSGSICVDTDGNSISCVTPSSESVILGQDNMGHSIKIAVDTNRQAKAQRNVGNTVTQGKAYVLSFLAKASTPVDLNLSLVNDSGTKAAFAQVALSDSWQIFQTNLIDLNHEATSSEYLLLEASFELETDNYYYIDNITLTEIVDRYYLIKNSWQTPDVCEADLEGKPHPLYMLGCDQYADRASKTHYLKSFSELCSESAVGCELMIDTKNSSATTTEIFNNDGTEKIVPADEFTYVVYDQNKLCNQSAKGCALLGKSYKYEDTILYGDIYLKNNPDKYNQILCGEQAVGCQIFTYGQSEKYFKDPGDQVCEWRRQTGAGESQGWFKKKVKRCGSDLGAVCLSDANCSGEDKCQLEIADKSCPLDTDNGGLAKTLGLGGAGGLVSQPGENSFGKWAGICAAANSGCGEYIDPVSRFNTNIIFNGSFQNLDNDPLTIDGWGAGITQDINLEPNTVYRLARLKQNDLLPDTLSIKCPAATELYGITSNNTLTGPKNATSTPEENYANSKIFYYRGNDKASCIITTGNASGLVELKPVVIGYQLAQNLDTQSCNGVVDFNKGCVLFNERSQESANLAKLKWDADTGKITGDINDEDKDSNLILKVTADRVCDKWLACKSYIKDEKGNNICYDLGLCDAVDDKNDCLSFLVSPKTNQTIESLGADKISNLSGYAKIGLQGGSLGGDYYPFGAMQQKGEVANIANGGFEFYGSNDYPLGWNWSGQEAAKKPWDTNVFSVINNPIAAQTEGIGYAREGRAFIKLGSSYDATSEDVDVLPDTDYIITAYVNTKNLKSRQAKIDIVDKDGLVIESGVIAQDLGNDWQFRVGKFKTAGGVSKIKIKLYADVVLSSEGNFYFDDIKIKPTLEAKCLEPDGVCIETIARPTYNAWRTAQSCRLYPKTDSLACDYFEDSGKRQKGWPGYCLEYDRPPGNPNTCILWYPVDRVKGDGIEEGAGYMGKFPVYYCLSASAVGCGADGKALIRCDKIVRTVNSIGQNKFWSSHVYQGSDWYTANENGSFINYDNTNLNKVFVGENEKQYNYSYDQTPFGSIVPPFSETNNPFDWDSRSDKGVQPLYLEAPPKGQSNLARAGSPFYCNADQSCYLMKFHDGRTFQLNSLIVKMYMFAECNRACLLSFNGKGVEGGLAERTFEIGNNTVRLIADASGDSGYCTNLMKALILPSGGKEKIVITKAGNETKTGGSPVVDCGNDNVDGGAAIEYADGEFITVIEVTYNDRKECKVNVNEGETGGIDRVKRLFAQSYDSWEWNSNGICKGGVQEGNTCANNVDDCQGSCSGYCVDTFKERTTEVLCDLKADINTSCRVLDIGKCVDTADPVENICVGVCNGGTRACTGSSLYLCPGGSCSGGVCNGGTRHSLACTDSNLCPGGSCSGNKNSLACNTLGSNDCKGCVGQTYGQCTGTPKKCRDGAQDGNVCSVPNDCPCTMGNRCVGGDHVGAVCTVPADCLPGGTCNNICIGPVGICLNICVGGARDGKTCDDIRQCNCSADDLATCNDINCPNYIIGDCVIKKTCDIGCYRDEVCNNIEKFCESKLTRCNQCLASLCSNESVCQENKCITGYRAGQDCISNADCQISCQGNKCVGGSKAGDPCNNVTDCQISCSNDDNCSGICEGIRYKPAVAQPDWGPPGANGEQYNGLCNVTGGGVRLASAYCAILPLISNIKIQDKAAGPVELTTSQFISLTFNSKVDSQQLPLVMYAIDWGDNEKTVMTGAEMRDRQDPDPADPKNDGNPHSLYHLYSYWDLKAKANSRIIPASSCTTVGGIGQCSVQPKIQIKDNWGWCNKGEVINICGQGQWDYFNGWVVVKEKQ